MLARCIARTQTTYKDINNFCNTTIILFLFSIFVGVLVFFSISPIQQVSVACFLYIIVYCKKVAPMWNKKSDDTFLKLFFRRKKWSAKRIISSIHHLKFKSSTKGGCISTTACWITLANFAHFTPLVLGFLLLFFALFLLFTVKNHQNQLAQNRITAYQTMWYTISRLKHPFNPFKIHYHLFFNLILIRCKSDLMD